MPLLGSRHIMRPVDALRAAKAGTLLIVDVRNVDERRRQWIPGSAHLPLSDLGSRLGELPAGPSLAFVCRSGRLGAIAAIAVRRAGRRTYNVKGGLAGWAAAGLPLSAPSPGEGSTSR
jgi:rhodanese-related sulfurtransferase